MIVTELRELLKGVPGDMQVLIPVNAEFDGLFRSPCMGESGVSQMADLPTQYDEFGGIIPHDEEAEENAPIKDVFLILPHGFGEEPENHVPPQLN